MPRPFALPDLGEGLTEAEIVKVLVREGDVISEDAPLLEVETDKATVEIPSPFSGRVAGIHVQPGQTVKVGHVLVTFDDSAAASSVGRGGGAPSGNLRTTTDSGRSPASPTHRQPASAAEARRALTASTTAVAGVGRGPASGAVASSRGANVGSASAGGALAADASGGAARVDSAGSGGAAVAAARVGPVPATPATRRLARELGVDLALVRASGPGGRVTDDDVRAAGGDAERRTVSAVEPAVEPVGAKPLKTIGAEPLLPKFEQWGPVERQP